MQIPLNKCFWSSGTLCGLFRGMGASNPPGDKKWCSSLLNKLQPPINGKIFHSNPPEFLFDLPWKICLQTTVVSLISDTHVKQIYANQYAKTQLIYLNVKQDKNCSISCVQILTCLDHQLAVGTTNGKVEVYLIPAKLPGRTKEVSN